MNAATTMDNLTAQHRIRPTIVCFVSDNRSVGEQSRSEAPIRQRHGHSLPLWSADRRTIYFRREQQIMALDTRDNTEREIYPGPTSNYVTISPDGKTLAFVQGPDIHSKMPHILALPTDGGNPRVLAEGAIGGGYWLLQWTPDGESLLFYKNATKELWRTSVRTGELTFVSKLPTEPNAGRISPDGRHFSYTLAGYVSEV